MEQTELFKSESPEQTRIRWSQPQEWKPVPQRDAILEEQPFRRPELETRTRKLKIEATGDFAEGLIKPKIRLMGRWLERAGFSPGNHVQVMCLAPGVMELRSSGALILKAAGLARSDEPF